MRFFRIYGNDERLDKYKIMPCPQLPKDVWYRIPSFAGDRGYSVTPTARLMHAVSFFYEPSPGRLSFMFGGDGYASTILHAEIGHFSTGTKVPRRLL